MFPLCKTFYGILQAAALLALLSLCACITGESTFQEQNAEYFIFAYPVEDLQGDFYPYGHAFSKSLSEVEAPQSIPTDALGRFVFEATTDTQTTVRARVQQGDDRAITLLDIDGPLSSERWCLNDASDFVAPRVRVLRELEGAKGAEALAAQELMESTAIFMETPPSMRFDHVCVSDGDNLQSRTMVALAYLLRSERRADLHLYIAAREHFAATGALPEQFEQRLRDGADNFLSTSRVLEAVEFAYETHGGKDLPTFPKAHLAFDLDRDGEADFYHRCLADDPACLCVPVDEHDCVCGNGVVEAGELCDPGEHGPACVDACTLLTVCGDGVIAGNEIVDTPACGSEQCFPEGCAMEDEACHGWSILNVNAEPPTDVWRVHGASTAFAGRRVDGSFWGLSSANPPAFRELGFHATDAAVLRWNGSEAGLIAVPQDQPYGMLISWREDGETTEFAIEDGASFGAEVECITAIDQQTLALVVRAQSGEERRLFVLDLELENDEATVVGRFVLPDLSEGACEGLFVGADLGWSVVWENTSLLWVQAASRMVALQRTELGDWQRVSEVPVSQGQHPAFASGDTLVSALDGQFQTQTWRDESLQTLNVCVSVDARTQVSAQAYQRQVLWSRARAGNVDVASWRVNGDAIGASIPAVLRMPGRSIIVAKHGVGAWIVQDNQDAVLVYQPDP